MVVGVVSPGAMGSALGAALARSGRTVVATLDGRSERTRELAARAPLALLPDLGDVVAASDVVLSVAPPGSAVAIARDIASAAAARGCSPLVADLNATSPTTVADVAAELHAGGLDLVDGSISGGPPWQAEMTRIYLSGPRAHEVAELAFDGVDVRVLGPELGTASALKMSTASVYKGIALLLTHALVTARAYGTVQDVMDDLRRVFPALAEEPAARVAMAASKSDRYVAEMREIAATQASAGLSPALFEAMAGAYEAISTTPGALATPEQAARATELGEVLDALAPTRP